MLIILLLNQFLDLVDIIVKKRKRKRNKLDPVQASAIDFAVAQEWNFYIKGEAGTGNGRTEWAYD